MSPTQRTLDWLKKAGFTAGIVEKHNPFGGPPTKKCPACGKNRIGVKQDLFGCIDLVAIHPDSTGVLGIQCTSDNNHAARREKILGLEPAKLWVQAGNRLWVLSWGLRGAQGKRKLWEPRIQDVTLGMFEDNQGGKMIDRLTSDQADKALILLEEMAEAREPGAEE